VLTVSGLILAATFVGCCGAYRQVERKGYFTGRKLLFVYLVFLITTFSLTASMTVYLSQSIDSMEWTVDELNTNSSAKMVGLEKSISRRVNGEYFEDLCSGSSSWFMNWVDKNCPASMGTRCKLPASKLSPNCDTYCDASPWNIDECCPDQIICESNSNVPQACPFYQCRKEMLSWVLDELDPAMGWLGTFGYFLVAMIFLTVLLICYNPRDDLEHELLKTGVIVESTEKKTRKKRSKTQQHARSPSNARAPSPHRTSNAPKPIRKAGKGATRTGPRRNTVTSRGSR